MWSLCYDVLVEKINYTSCETLGLFMSATICVDILQFSFTSICRYYSSLKQHIYLFIFFFRYLETVKPLYGFLFSPDSHPFLFSFCFSPLFLHVIFHTVGRSRLRTQRPCLSQAQGSPGRRERNPGEESPPANLHYRFTGGSHGFTACRPAVHSWWWPTEKKPKGKHWLWIYKAMYFISKI